MRVFRLYAFTDGKVTVVTRGENQEQAMSYASRDNGSFPKGVTIYSLDYLPINAAELYNTNHSCGWLYRSPCWLAKIENEQAIQMGVNNILNSIFAGEQHQPLMFQNN